MEAVKLEAPEQVREEVKLEEHPRNPAVRAQSQEGEERHLPRSASRRSAGTRETPGRFCVPHARRVPSSPQQ